MNLITTRGAVLQPVEVDVDKARLGDARQPVVVVLVDGRGECRVEVDVVLLEHRSESVADVLVFEPLLQFQRPDRVVDNALKSLS